MVAVDTNGFDRGYYLSKYPDIAAAGVDPYQHYLDYGWREGRDPNGLFDTSFYLLHNPDVAAAGVNPLTHYMTSGWREGRDPSPAFDTTDYVYANPDIAAAKVNPLLHYLQHGQFEHRILTYDQSSWIWEGFDSKYYLANNPDVAAAGDNPYVHYQAFGISEGRKPNAGFNRDFYLAHNPDVAAAGDDPLYHFMTYGWREGRDPSADFSLTEYRQATGVASDVNPLFSYLLSDQYSGWAPFDITNVPHIIQARGNPLDAVLIGQVTFNIDGPLTHVTAPLSPLGGHDLSGYLGYNLSRSIADIVISGSGPLPSSISLGTGDDRISGVFTLGGRILNLHSGAGSLSINAQLDNGSAAIIAGNGDDSDIFVHGSAAVSFIGGIGADIVHLGDNGDNLFGGGGINHLNGGGGKDTASWNAQVRADLLTGQATWLGGGDFFADTLFSMENLGGSPFNDILLGDDSANTITSVNFSPSVSGDDILAGRGDNDILWGFDGADILIGGRGADILVGGDGNDLLIDAADIGGNAMANGGAGNDRFVCLLSDAPDPILSGAFYGGDGADIFIFDTSLGRRGNFAIEFSQIDNDRLDLSALRSASGNRVSLADVQGAASGSSYGSTMIDLAMFRDTAGNALQGHINLNGVFAATDLRATDFIFEGGYNWRLDVPVDLFGLL